jgi:hypothetical protein
MTREQALAQARKRWGKTAYIRAYDGIGLSSPESREEATARLRARRERVKAIDAEIDARLATLDWYVALKDERKMLTKGISEEGWQASHYKFLVGTCNGIGFAVQGQGDTWEEAFRAADKAKQRDAERFAAQKEGQAR